MTCLVNNAGVLGPSGRLEDVSIDQIHAVLNTNLVGAILCVQSAAKLMSTARGGSGGVIVNISSGSAYIGSPALYAVSKGGLNSMQHAMSQPLAAEGVRMNTVSPGLVATDMPDPAVLASGGANIPRGSVGTPEEIADVVRFLCSDKFESA